MAKLTVNGLEVEVANGTSVLDAVFHAGFDVPYFCSNEYLSPVGACRMCLVEALVPRKAPDGSLMLDDSGKPKLFNVTPNPTVASCVVGVQDNMVVRTESEVVKKAQAGMMEFTLLNHPLDCPTCDKGGACELQDRAYEYGYGENRFEFTRRHTDKHHALSEFIVLDKERCIHCKRCVRYFEEIPGEEVLDFVERGSHTFIDSFESEDLAGRPLGNFSGNINDLCPVGALLDNVSRFRGRNWEYDRVQTTCTGCSVGCDMWVDARTGRIERIRGGDNASVNEIWLCDAGRFGHEWVDADSRPRTPMVRRDGQLQTASWEEAIAAIRAGFAGIAADKIGLYAGADITLEEGVALERFAVGIGNVNVDHFPRFNAALSSANRPTLDEVARADAVVVIGADITEEAPVLDLRIQEMLKGYVSEATLNHGALLADLKLTERMNRKRQQLAVLAPVPVRLQDHAGIKGSYLVGGELELLKAIAALKADANAKISDKFDTSLLKQVAQLLNTAKRPIIILGAFALSASNASEVLAAAGRVALKVLPLPAGANGAGLELLNLVPGQGKNANGSPKSGISFGNWSELSAALLSGVTPSNPSQLRKLDFLVVHDCWDSPALQYANVVLPAQSNYEKRGTTVNLEGRFFAFANSSC
jgi:NADH-quinone oxidoreductase subunit G